MSETVFTVDQKMLREGDRLTAEEFLRRWETMPDLRFAELIDGVVHMPSPRQRKHGIRLGAWISRYADDTPGCEPAADTTWRMGPIDVPQPDLDLRILPEYGGQSRDDGEYGGGAPELVVEVAVSTAARDRGRKLELYRRMGVREYISVVVTQRQVVWRQWIDGRYEEIAPDPDGLLRSRVFPGLWLDPAAVWGSARSLLAAVEQGVRSPEHAEVVRRLAARRGPA